MEKEKIRKILNILGNLYFIAGICTLVLFIPQVREFIILFGEKHMGRPLTHDVWHERFLNWECQLIFLMLAAVILFKAAKFIFFRIKEFRSEPDMTCYSYLENKLKAVTTDAWLHYISLAVFIIALCVIHFCMPESGDDFHYSSILKENSPFINYGFLKSHYNSWSSRMIIEAVLLNCYRLNFGVWRFFDVAAFVLIAECIIQLCFPKKRYAAFVYAVILIFTDYNSLYTAGWGATTVNYVWPMAAAMPCFVMLKELFEGKTPVKLQIAVTFILLVFAINQEQVAALILGLSVTFLIFSIIKNRRFQKADLYLLSLIILCVASIVFILTCPGNKNRLVEETKTWFPEYPTLSLFDKIQLGLLTILPYYLSDKVSYFISNTPALVIIPLCIVLSFALYKKSRKNFIIQAFLDAFVLLTIPVRIVTKDFLLANNKLAQFSNYSQAEVLLECLVLLIIVVLFLYQMYAVMKSKFQGLFNVLLMCAGFCSAFIIAFSPTVYASLYRCYIFMSYMIFLITFRIFYDFVNTDEKSAYK